MNELNSSAKTSALIGYGLMIFGMFTGIGSLIGVIWAYIKAGDYKDSIFADHFANIKTTFWVSLLLAIVGIVTALIGVGYIIFAVSGIYYIFKTIKGIARLTSDKPYRDSSIVITEDEVNNVTE